MTAGLVQQPDKIVVRFAHTIYPYSLGKVAKIISSRLENVRIDFRP